MNSPKPTSTLTNCSKCKKQIEVHKSVSVYGIKQGGHHGGCSKRLCGFCLVGYYIPVIRPSIGKWEFGKIIFYKGSGLISGSQEERYEAAFTDKKKEWVCVEIDPFEAYVKHFDDKLFGTGRSPRKISDNRNRCQQLHSGQNENENKTHSSHEDPFNFQPKNIFASGETDSVLHKPKQHTLFDDQFDNISFPRENYSGADSPFKIEARNLDASTDQGHHSPFTERQFVHKVAGFEGLVNNQKSSLSDSSQNVSLPSASSSQRSPRLWTPDEDKLLLKSITSNNNQLNWPKIAKDIHGRSGKQCRERYLNHLGPHLKRTRWSANEDATIFRLHSLYGPKWSQIVKFLPGRTDNGTKNRFHHIWRRFQRKMKCLPDSKELEMSTRQIEKYLPLQRLRPDKLIIRDLAMRLLLESQRATTNKHNPITGDGEHKFGPFEQANESRGCARCGLIIPSRETGTTFCRQTGWCETCTGASLVISSDLLRLTHLLTKQNEAPIIKTEYQDE